MILAKFFLRMFINWGNDSVFLNLPKKSKANIQPSGPNKLGKKDLLFGFQLNFSYRTQLLVLKGQDGSISPAWVANHSVEFSSTCPLTELQYL